LDSHIFNITTAQEGKVRNICIFIIIILISSPITFAQTYTGTLDKDMLECWTLTPLGGGTPLAIKSGPIGGSYGDTVQLFGTFIPEAISCAQDAVCCFYSDSAKPYYSGTNPPNNVPLSSPTTIVLLALIMTGIGFATYKIRH